MVRRIHSKEEEVFAKNRYLPYNNDGSSVFEGYGAVHSVAGIPLNLASYPAVG
jgi:hypothetical protein